MVSVSVTMNDASGANSSDADLLISFPDVCVNFEMRLRDLGQGFVCDLWTVTMW
ncbi:hypothetical protein HanXRQr2_Chr12g0525231 [Helianthus annuus]|uniref:Uncharacterized protein n=1 Tax=Helianthus annuus TaxID=4232 RepID=A0A9K3EMV9_HELAN|nr:hypothetical protein HanXRQr2_Chr12g0525231 [Helianthus annuus]